MANREQIERLRAGVAGWNQWREEHRLIELDFTGADLSGADLSGAQLGNVTFINADLSRTRIHLANLSLADLSGADLSGAHISITLLIKANLAGANLTGADLSHSMFRSASIANAQLSNSILTSTIFTDVDLTRADFSYSLLGATTFDGVDLSTVVGLDTVMHVAGSTIGIDTLYLSKGHIPESFLWGCGVPDSMIDYARSLVAAERPIDYYSCFISYSSKDEALAKRLHADLQAAGVRCWYAPEDLKIGESILGGIDHGIRLHDKLLLLLSEASVRSAWVETEVNLALARERAERRRVLFPVRIDDAVLTSGAAWAALVRADHQIGDFCAWKEHDRYQAVFARLLRDLRAGV